MYGKDSGGELHESWDESVQERTEVVCQVLERLWRKDQLLEVWLRK